MKITRVASLSLTCALFTAACGGSDKPAQDPTAMNTTSAPTDMPAAGTPSSSAMPSTTPSATDTTNSGPTNGSMTGTSSAGTGTMPSTTPPPSSPPPATTPSTPAPTGATAVQNPGVADGTKNADNTKINDRDRHGALTPMDQGNSANETKITASIRKAIMADKTLSFASKNVKVITVGTKVTLRGAVKSDQEKAAIESAAKQTTGVTEVDNQLEVKK